MEGHPRSSQILHNTVYHLYGGTYDAALTRMHFSTEPAAVLKTTNFGINNHLKYYTKKGLVTGMLPGEIVFGDNFAGMLPGQSPDNLSHCLKPGNPLIRSPGAVHPYT